MMHPLLRLDDVHHSFTLDGPRELRVLKGVSVDVHRGEFVGVYGQRDAGKTTLLRIAAGFEQPTSGCVYFDGRDLATLSRGDFARLHRHDIGWVETAGPQSCGLKMRIYVALPLYRQYGPNEAQRRAVAALARVGVEDVANQLWSSLSGGTRMLVAVAQALVREPRLLLLDYPTFGLNVIERERILGLLRSAAEDGGLGILMAVPEMPAILHAHEIRSLSRGRLLAPSSGPPDHTVLKFPGSMRSA